MKLLPRFAESLMPSRPALARILKGWCQGDYATDAQGASVEETSPHAVSWCAFGSIKASYGPDNFEPVHRLGNVLDRKGCNIPYWNDDPSRTHGDVIQAFYAAGI